MHILSIICRRRVECQRDELVVWVLQSRVVISLLTLILVIVNVFEELLGVEPGEQMQGCQLGDRENVLVLVDDVRDTGALLADVCGLPVNEAYSHREHQNGWNYPSDGC